MIDDRDRTLRIATRVCRGWEGLSRPNGFLDEDYLRRPRELGQSPATSSPSREAVSRMPHPAAASAARAPQLVGSPVRTTSATRCQELGAGGRSRGYPAVRYDVLRERWSPVTRIPAAIDKPSQKATGIRRRLGTAASNRLPIGPGPPDLGRR